MNVSKGDLCMLVESAPCNKGAIGTVLEYWGSPTVSVYEGREWFNPDGSPAWIVTWHHPLTIFNMGNESTLSVNSCPTADSCLRRICPPPGELIPDPVETTIGDLLGHDL